MLDRPAPARGPVTVTSAASVLDSRPAVDGFFRVRNPQKIIVSAAGALPSELAVFACDFSRLRADLPGPCRCAGAFARRPRPACGGHGDLEDQGRLREALLSRPAGWSGRGTGGAH